MSEPISAPFTDPDIAELHALALKGAGVRIGMLDSGVDADHALLRGRVTAFRDSAPNGLAIFRAAPVDRTGHGTRMAGILAGLYHGCAPIGLAPAAELCVGAVIEEGAVVARTLLGLDWLAAERVGVVLLALGLPGASRSLCRPIRALIDRDVLVVAPVGNCGAGRALPPGDVEGVVSVGAVDATGHVARFSGSLNDPVTGACLKPDLLAPGVDRLTTARRGARTSMSGTSVAAAVVAGIAAVLRARFPEATATQVAYALSATAEAAPTGQTHRARRGRVRPLAAVERLAAGGMETRGDHLRDASERRIVPHALDRSMAFKLAREPMSQPVDAVVEFTDMRALHEGLTTVGDALDGPICLSQSPVMLGRFSLATIAELARRDDVVGINSAHVTRGRFNTAR